MRGHKLNTAKRHIRAMITGMADNKALSARQIVDAMPGVNRHNVIRWLAGDHDRRLAEGTIDRIIEVVNKAPVP